MSAYSTLKTIVVAAPTEKVRYLAGRALALMVQRLMWKEGRAGNVLETPASEYHGNLIINAVWAVRDEITFAVVPATKDKDERERLELLAWHLVY